MEKKRSKQLSPLLQAATSHRHPADWREKLRSLVETTSSRSALETLGEELNVEQTLELIDWALEKDTSAAREAIGALFAKLKQSIFCNVLLETTPSQLDFLKRDSSVETIQHHLSQLSHELKERFVLFCDKVVHESGRLDTLDLSQLRSEDIDILHHSLDEIAKEGRDIIHLTSVALALAWNTNRTDIIQELSHTKELCEQCLIRDVGNPTIEEAQSSGLWHVLKAKLDSVFSDMDTQGSLTLMKDSDFALEALVKFSVWHIRDYCEVGLIPHADKDIPAERRDNLFALAERNLSKLGLKTLLDLKREKIYSKRALMEFIQRKR